MPWFKITLKAGPDTESTMIGRFLDAMVTRPSGSPPASLWVQDRDVLEGEAWYYLETDDPASFRELIDETGALERTPPDLSLLSPAAGTASAG